MVARPEGTTTDHNNRRSRNFRSSRAGWRADSFDVAPISLIVVGVVAAVAVVAALVGRSRQTTATRAEIDMDSLMSNLYRLELVGRPIEVPDVPERMVVPATAGPLSSSWAELHRCVGELMQATDTVRRSLVA
jgi:hypothetical protein